MQRPDVKSDRTPKCRVSGEQRARGFTLIELMITVAIVAILAAVAYPSYTDAVLKGRRAEGRTALLDLMQQQERFLTQTGSYASFTPTDTGLSFKNYSGDSRSASAYTLGARACSTTLTLRDCVQLYATPTRSDPKANELTITSTGQKSCNGTQAPSVCWK